MIRFALVALAAAAALSCVLAAAAGRESDQPAADPPPSSGRSDAVAGETLAARAERLFFDALNRRPEQRSEAIEALFQAVAAEPTSGPLNLWLGLSHLWVTAESTSGSRAAVEHAILAEHHLATARRLMSEDDRIVSWLSPVRIRLGQRSGDHAAVQAAWEELRTAVKNDPCFHAVAMGLLMFDEPRASAGFVEGLEALRAAAACGPDDPSVQNRHRWPHNLEGFALALAQYELKAGNRQRAESLLMFAQERPTYGRWPHRGVLEGLFDTLNDAAARYGNDDPRDDPPLVIAPGSGMACRVCHQSQ